MQLLKSTRSRSYLFFAHFFLAQPHQSFEGILDENLHLRGGALPQSFPQQVLAPDLASGADLLLLGHAEIDPFGEGNFAADLALLRGLLAGQFALLLDLLDELDASADGDGHGGFCGILRPAVEKQLGVGECVASGVVEEPAGAVLTHNLETSVLADATKLVAARRNLQLVEAVLPPGPASGPTGLLLAVLGSLTGRQ